jgi:hypothetical protein
MGEIRFPAGGWLRPGTPISWQRNDHGKDLVIPWNGIIQAPGAGHCIGIGQDAPYPNGFGPRFALIHIDDGPWKGFDAYLGHDTALVSSGEHFPFGHGLARANQGHPSVIGIHPPNPPGDGGWIEFGQFFPATGRCGVDSPTGHFYDSKLMAAMIVKTQDRTLKLGMKGWDVLRETAWLHDCGYLSRRWFRYTKEVRDATIAFQAWHHIDHGDGQIGPRTRPILRAAAHWCRVHHHKEAHGALIKAMPPIPILGRESDRLSEGMFR